MPWRADAPHAGFSPVEPWLPVDPRHPPLAVDRQDPDEASVLNLTRRLIARRKREPALRLGSLRFLDAPAPLLAFERARGDDVLTCVFNLGHEAVVWSPAGDIVPLETVNADGAGPTTLTPLSGRIGRRRSI